MHGWEGEVGKRLEHKRSWGSDEHLQLRTVTEANPVKILVFAQKQELMMHGQSINKAEKNTSVHNLLNNNGVTCRALRVVCRLYLSDSVDTTQ